MAKTYEEYLKDLSALSEDRREQIVSQLSPELQSRFRSDFQRRSGTGSLQPAQTDRPPLFGAKTEEDEELRHDVMMSDVQEYTSLYDPEKENWLTSRGFSEKQSEYIQRKAGERKSGIQHVLDVPVIGDITEGAIQAGMLWHEHIDKPFAAAMTAPAHEGLGSLWKPFAAAGTGVGAALLAGPTGGASLVAGAAAMTAIGAGIGKVGETEESYDEWDSPKYVKGIAEITAPGNFIPFAAPFKIVGLTKAAGMAAAVERGIAYPLTKPLSMAGGAVQKAIGAGARPGAKYIPEFRPLMDRMEQDFPLTRSRKMNEWIASTGDIPRRIVEMIGGKEATVGRDKSGVRTLKLALVSAYEDAEILANNTVGKLMRSFDDAFKLNDSMTFNIKTIDGYEVSPGIVDIIRNPSHFQLDDAQKSVIGDLWGAIDEVDAGTESQWYRA